MPEDPSQVPWDLAVQLPAAGGFEVREHEPVLEERVVEGGQRL